MTSITSRIVATTIAGLALTGVATSAAQAAPGDSFRKDVAAVKAANKVCKVISDDYSFEACVVGEVAERRGRVILGDAYVVDNSSKQAFQLVGPTLKPRATKVTRVTKADRKALKAAQAQANYATTMENDAQWMNVLVGDFILNRGRFIDSGMVAFTDSGKAKLSRHSLKV